MACGGSDDDRTIQLKNEPTPFRVPLAQAAVPAGDGWVLKYMLRERISGELQVRERLTA